MSAPGIGPVANAPALPQDRYWASVEGDDLPEVLLSKALRYRDRLRRDGRLDLMRRSERLYYGQDATGGMANSAAVQFGGEAGELVLIRVNHYRSILQGIIATVVNRRLAYDPRATNNDAESAKQVTLAKSLLEFYGRELGDDEMRVDTVRVGLTMGEGYTAQRWNPNKGKPYAVERIPDPSGAVDETGQPATIERLVFEGDVEAQTFTPVEVVHDLDATERELRWVMLPYRANVWDLAAQNPDKQEEILKLRGSPQQRWPRSAWSAAPFEKSQSSQETDIVTVWWFYHLPCASLPEGRHAQVVGDVLLHDGPMLLPRIPLRVIMPEREMSVSRGHSPAFDLLALQEAYDSVIDTILSMIDAYGMQNVITPKGSDLTPEQISKGLQFLEWTPDPELTNGGKPEVLNLLEMPASLPDALDRLQRLMETLSGINSVVRGDPLPQLKSGAALALVQSLAVAFNTNLQAAVISHDEGVATDRLMLLKQYAVNKRNVEIVGKANRGSMVDWSRDDLETVQRVTIEVGSPLQDQTAGKMEIAQQFLTQDKFPITPGQYFEVLTTGRLEPVYRGPKAAEDLIIRENEYLADGSGVVVVRVTDDHGMHVQEHAAVLAEQHVRADPAATERVMQHILEHEKTWLSMDPALAMITKQSLGPPPQPVAPGLAPPPPAGPGGKPSGPANGSLNDGPPDASKARPLGGDPPPGGPSMPTNPLTNTRAPQPV